ncbi:hypothetical protein BH11BAC2_BH11BAC2_01970 [soil metagenome]
MKKSTLLVCTLLLSGLSVFAQQSLAPSNFTQTVSDPGNTTVLESHVTLVNIGASDVNVGVERIINNFNPNMYELFCFGAWCYPPGTAVAGNATLLPAGATNTTFKAQVDPNSTCDNASLHYRFYDQNNIADSIGLTLNFNFCAVGLADNKEEFGISKALRNPADSYTLFTYNFPTSDNGDKVVIYNMLGSLIKTLDLPGKNGTLMITTSELKAGVYFVSYVSGNKVQSTSKLVVSHH